MKKESCCSYFLCLKIKNTNRHLLLSGSLEAGLNSGRECIVSGFCWCRSQCIVVVVFVQLDEKVRDWQESDVTASRCYWVTERASWAGLIPSAVRFLSDGILGLFYVLYFFTTLEMDNR